MNRVFLIFVAVVCFAVLCQFTVLAQQVVVDDGTNAFVYDATGGGPAATGLVGIQLDATGLPVEIVGTTTTFGATLGAPVVTINNTTGDISGVGALGATSITATGAVNGATVNGATVNGTTINGTTINGTTVNVTTLNATTLSATALTATGLISGTGGLDVTSANGQQTLVVDNLVGRIKSDDGAGNFGLLAVTKTQNLMGLQDVAGNATVIQQTIAGGTFIQSYNGVTGATGSLTVASTGTSIVGGLDVTGGINNNFGGIAAAGRISGVSDGILGTDAINVRQLGGAIGGLRSSLSSGIASIAALASIPGPVCNKNYSLGAGFGHYNGEDAWAIGGKANLPKSCVSVAAGVGFSTNSSPAINAGASFSF
jgi:hypothetical protein